MWRTPRRPTRSSPIPSSSISTTCVPSLAGPKRPQDRVTLDIAKADFATAPWRRSSARPAEIGTSACAVEGANFDLGHGDVVIAAITSCTNTSNPSVMIGAGLLARNAVAKGLKTKPWVKTSLAPGSQIVAEYFEKAGLQGDLDALGFNLVGFGCTTCIGNSGPLPENVSKAINDNDLVAVLGALRKPQLRGPRQPGRAGELSRLAAARRRLCARRLDVSSTSDEGSARHRQRRQAGLSASDIWPSSVEDAGVHRPHDHQRTVQEPLCGRVHGRCELEGRDGRGRPDLQVEHAVRPTCRTRPTSRA